MRGGAACGASLEVDRVGWVKHLPQYMVICKANALPGWFLIPE